MKVLNSLPVSAIKTIDYPVCYSLAGKEESLPFLVSCINTVMRQI